MLEAEEEEYFNEEQLRQHKRMRNFVLNNEPSNNPHNIHVLPPNHSCVTKDTAAMLNNSGTMEMDTNEPENTSTTQEFQGNTISQVYNLLFFLSTYFIMKVLSWNCQGFKSKVTRDHLHHLITLHNPDIVFVSETKINDHRILKLSRAYNFPNTCYVPSIGETGGLLLLWKYGFKLDIVNSSINMIHAIILNDPSISEWFLTYMYGTPYKEQQDEQRDYIKDLSKSVNILWVVVGDLNITLNKEDKCNHAVSSSNNYDVIKQKLRDSDLSDLGFNGNPFTWTNNSHDTGRIKTRLDRALVNSNWFYFFHTQTSLMPISFSSYIMMLTLKVRIGSFLKLG